VLVSSQIISEVAVDLLGAMDVPRVQALQIVGSLVLADRRGVPTHGLALLPLYRDMVAAGVIRSRSKPAVRTTNGAIAAFDGRGAFGQITGRIAVEYGLELMKPAGIAAVGIADGTHLGRLGEWAEIACDSDAVFMGFVNTGGGALTVAGPEGTNRVLAPNPVVFGVPATTPLGHHLIVDFACSQVSGSRIREVANAGTPLGADWVVAQDGTETENPSDFLSGRAALRPLGGATAGHKGFGLMMVAEALAGLAGGPMAGEQVQDWFSNGALFIVMDVKRFLPRGDWGQRMAGLASYLGDRGYRMPGSGSGHRCDADDLDIADHALAAILATAEDMGVDCRGLTAPPLTQSITRSW